VRNKSATLEAEETASSRLPNWHPAVACREHTLPTSPVIFADSHEGASLRLVPWHLNARCHLIPYK